MVAVAEPEQVQDKPVNGTKPLPEHLKPFRFGRDARSDAYRAKGRAKFRENIAKRKEYAAQANDPVALVQTIGLEQMRMIGKKLADPCLQPANRRILIQTLKELRDMIRDSAKPAQVKPSTLEPLPESKPSGP